MSGEKNFLQLIFRYTTENRLFTAPCRVLLGLSGGADSMALLQALSTWPEEGLEVVAVHVHHGLRGVEADRDEAFVREQCANRSVPLEVVHVNVAQLAEAEGCGLEEAGRQARYAAFERYAREYACDCIATAHTASDRAETVLMHLIRGCGTEGLVGISPKRDTVVRPLLGVTRQQVEAFCAEEGISYVNDSTNGDLAFTRNAVRHQVLPLLRQLNSGADAALLRLADHAAEDSAYLLAQAAEALGPQNEEGYSLTGFSNQPAAIRRRMIALILQQTGHYTVEEKHILLAEAAVLAGAGGVLLPGGDRFSVCDGQVRVERAQPLVPLTPVALDGELPLSFSFGGEVYELRLLEGDEARSLQNVHKMFFKYAVDYDKIQGGLQVRGRQEGDYFHPAGRHIGKTLKKLMNEWHVAAEKRDALPLLCDEVGVLLIPGYGCDERVRPEEKTKSFLVWVPLSEKG